MADIIWHRCSMCGERWAGTHQCAPVQGKPFATITGDMIRDGEKAVREGRFTTLDQIKAELMLREEVEQLRAALREISKILDRGMIRHSVLCLAQKVGDPCVCGRLEIRAIVERAVGGES